MKKRKWWLIVLIIFIFVLAIRLILNNNSWVCMNGEWVEHGAPKSEKPTGYCIEGNVDNFKECIAMDGSVLGSSPRKCIYENQTFTELIENFCSNEDVTGICMTLYEPVCGYPIEKTFSNSCFACNNQEVIYWIKGECL